MYVMYFEMSIILIDYDCDVSCACSHVCVQMSMASSSSSAAAADEMSSSDSECDEPCPVTNCQSVVSGTNRYLLLFCSSASCSLFSCRSQSTLNSWTISNVFRLLVLNNTFWPSSVKRRSNLNR